MEQVVLSAIDFTERLVSENKHLKLKIKLMAKHNAKLAGLDIEKIDVRGLKKLIGGSYTNGDRIRKMSDEELVEFLKQNFKTENIAENWFEKAYCKNEEKCKMLEGVCEDAKLITFFKCDTTEGCPHQKNETVIAMWLKSEAE